MPKKAPLDDLDIKILETLQTKGNITNRELAKEIGLTPGPTLVRVQNLKKENILLPSSPTINWDKLGFTFQAIVLISVNKEDEPIMDDLITKVEGVLSACKVVRDSIGSSKFVHYSCRNYFKSEKDFSNSWGYIISKCQYPVDFKIWQVEKMIFTNNPIKIPTQF